MSVTGQDRLSRLFEHFPRVVAVIAAAMGVLVLSGWIFDVAALKGVMPGWTLMKANTAIGFILCGVALWSTQARGNARLWRVLVQVCSATVLLLGLLTLVEYLSGADFGLDQLLIREITILPGDIPGRMAVSTALGFSASGAALLLVGRREGGFVSAIHALLLVPLVMSGSALIGYGYDIEEFLREKLAYTPMALPTAALFVLLALGIASARPGYPFRRFMVSESAAGLMVRRLLPGVIVLTLAIGWSIQRGYHAGYFGEVFGLALFAAVSIAGLTILVLWSARTFDAGDVRRRQAEEESRAASLYARSLIEASVDPLVTISADGKITDVNDATEEATGLTRTALIGSDFSNYFTEPEKARAGYREVFAKGFVTDYPLALRNASGRIMEVLYNARVYRNAQGEVAGVFAAARDITERKQNDAVNAARLHLVQFALTHTLDELLEETLNEAERLTGSLIGFYHFVEADQNSLTLQTWSTRTKAEFCKAEGKGLHYPLNDAGVWADCARQGRPVIHNDYASLPNRKGMPEGHARVVREVVVPVRRGAKISAILGVGNKATDYDDRDVEMLLLVADLTGEIAARKRAEEALHKSAEEIEDLYNRAPIGYHSVSKDGTIVRINDTELAWLGYARDEVLGKKNFADLLTLDSLNMFRATFETSKERGWVSDLEYDLVRKDGTILPVLLSATAVKDAQGNFVMSRSTIYDNTERKKLEAHVREAAAYTRSLIEASPDPLVTISAEGKITDVNEATIGATGVAREQLLGSDFSNYFTEPEKARAGYQEVFAKGYVTDYPLALRHASGAVIEVLYNASVYRSENGEVAGVFAAARDVTELKRAEHALKERVKELQAFFHLAELAARADFALDSLCQELANVLPQSWQYPEVTCSRIVLGEREFRTPNFGASEWVQAAPIKVLGTVAGKVEVGYLQRKPEADEGPFLKEERQLIDAIAGRVGQIAGLKRAETALRTSEELFRALASATSEGMLIHEHGRIVEINRQMEDILGRQRAELVGAAMLDFVAPAWRDIVSKRVQAPEDIRVEIAFLRPDGSEVIVSGLAHSCVYQGRPMRVAAYRDITLEKRAEEALRNVGVYNRSLIEVSLDPLVTISPDGKIADVNEATIQATGMPRSLLIGSDFSNYFTEPEKARAGYQEVFAKGFVTDYPLSLRHVSGRVTEVLYNASVYRNATGEVAGVFAAARDITERRKLERELERQAHIDLLTDLHTRRHFMELAEVERARSRRHGEPLSLLMMDLDNFKAVNDTYGHDVGDATLQKLSEVCRHTFREVDIVGRLGGEEFAALLPETSMERAEEVAERLRLSVERAAVKLESGSLIHFTVSVGVAGFRPADERIETVLKRADTALYRAKNAGRNRVCREDVQ